MLRLIASLTALPFLLMALLAMAVASHQGRFGSLSGETFEFGPLPLVLAISLAMLLVFVPLLLVFARFSKTSLFSTAAAGFLSAFLPVLVSSWPVVSDTRLHLAFRAERLADSYAWLTVGLLGGLLFWLLAIFRNPALTQLFKTSQ
jgi:hypothetical protein